MIQQSDKTEEKNTVIPIRRTRRKMKARKGMNISKDNEGDKTDLPKEVRPFVKVVNEIKEVPIDANSITTKLPIVDFSSKETIQESYIITRKDGERRVYSNVEDIDKNDVIDLYKLLEDRRKVETLTGYELFC